MKQLGIKNVPIPSHAVRTSDYRDLIMEVNESFIRDGHIYKAYLEHDRIIVRNWSEREPCVKCYQFIENTFPKYSASGWFLKQSSDKTAEAAETARISQAINAEYLNYSAKKWNHTDHYHLYKPVPNKTTDAIILKTTNPFSGQEENAVNLVLKNDQFKELEELMKLSGKNLPAYAGEYQAPDDFYDAASVYVNYNVFSQVTGEASEPWSDS